MQKHVSLRIGFIFLSFFSPEVRIFCCDASMKLQWWLKNPPLHSSCVSGLGEKKIEIKEMVTGRLKESYYIKL